PQTPTQSSACSYPNCGVNRDLLDSNSKATKTGAGAAGHRGAEAAPGSGTTRSSPSRQYTASTTLKALRSAESPVPGSNSCPDPPRPLLTLPNAADRRLLSGGRCQPSMAFVDETAACVADGCCAGCSWWTRGERGQLRGQMRRMQANPSSSIHFDSESNIDNKDWEACATFETEPSLLVYARRYSATNQLHCLLMRVCESSADANKSTNDDKSSDGFRCVLDWFTYQSLGSPSSHGNYQQIRRLTLESSCVPNYACFDAECRHLLLECDRPFEFVDKDDKNTSKTTAPSSGNVKLRKLQKLTMMKAALNPSGGRQLPSRWRRNRAPSPYTGANPRWMDQGVFIPLPTGVGKADIEVTNTGVALRVAIHGRPVLDGPLYEVPNYPTPPPRQPLPFVAGASSGDLYNAQELEDCDLPEAGGDGDGGLETGALVWIDGEAKRVVALTVAVRHRVTPSEPPYVCLRRDVDGLLWRPDFSGGDASSIWQHVTTFHAFGYVTSKLRKPTPNFFGYAAICDCYRHVYVYHSPRPADTVLRNRQSGRVIAERSTQQVVSLATQDAL
uniref:DUF3506 domain-containing protein n=1 Tax=Macrostomum lignano TaxID=282301 RepID=A0A1I8JNV3_9PLAT